MFLYLKTILSRRFAESQSLKRPFRTTMAANGGNMGKRKSTKKNTKGKFFSSQI
jgi:hypothetical protein